MSRRRFIWTAKQLDKLNRAQEILGELREYVPLTLRQVFYQMVGKEYIENTKPEYQMLSILIKWARIDEFIPWEMIEDRVRAFHDFSGLKTKEEYIWQELREFLGRYRRDILQTQDKYLEVWIEKDALSSLFSKVCYPYTVPVVVCRGFSSVSFLNDFRERLSQREDKVPVMLYFGDFDPSGVEMLDAMKITLKEELRIDDIVFKRIALLKEDIFTYKLPHNPFALKKTDTRARKHIERYGELAVELDAMRPDILEGRIKQAIGAELDIPAFNREVRAERQELGELKRIKKKTEAFIKTIC